MGSCHKKLKFILGWVAWPQALAPSMNLLFTASFPGFTPAPPPRATRNEADLKGLVHDRLSRQNKFVNTKFEIAITGTISENPSFYSDIRRFGRSSYTSVVVINLWLCRLTGYVLRRRKK